MMKQAKKILMACAALLGVVQVHGDPGGEAEALKPSVTMTRCRLTGNSAPMGGAFAAIGDFALSLTDTVVVSNKTTEAFTASFYLPASGLKVGGSTVIADNKGGNLALESGQLMTVADDFAGCIGVTLLTEPTHASPVTITGACAEDQSSRIFLDNGLLNLTNMTDNTLVVTARTTEPIPSTVELLAKASVETYTNGVISLDGTVWSNRTAEVVYKAKTGYAFEDGKTEHVVRLDTSKAVATIPPGTVIPKIVQTIAPVMNVPKLVSYRGLLTDAAGRKYTNGVHTVDFRIWTAASGTERCLWGARYSVYVEDGVFDVLLGNPNAQDLRAIDGTLPEYDKEDLWMVAWNEPSADGYYLGVTPHQDADGKPLAVRTEIATRPKVMSAGFAFQAQYAKYAEESVGDFAVNGRLSVEGAATIEGAVNATGGNVQIGPIAANGSEVKLVGAKEAEENQPKVTTAGNDVYVQSWGDTTFGSKAGDVTINAAEGHAIRVTGAGSFVSDLVENTVGGTGATTVRGKPIVMQANGGNAKYTQDVGTIAFSGLSGFDVTSPNFGISSSGSSWLTGSWVDMRSRGSARAYLSGNTVIGEGSSVQWYSSGYAAPVVFRTVTLTAALNQIGSSAWSVSKQVSSSSTAEWARYNWFVAGWICDCSGSGWCAPSEVRVTNTSGGLPYVSVSGYGRGRGVTCQVTLIGILKDWSRNY